jgi:hypothetical protein
MPEVELIGTLIDVDNDTDFCTTHQVHRVLKREARTTPHVISFVHGSAPDQNWFANSRLRLLDWSYRRIVRCPQRTRIPG